MRITAGKYRSRKLEAPKNDDVRPTSDKVRQALFNALNSRGLVIDSVVLDAFCGTGALGLEALSQGAAHCIFMDKSKNSYNLCRKNIALLAAESQSDIFFQDSTKAKLRPDDLLPANLIFLDPPYHKRLVEKAIESLIQGGWVTDDAAFVIEAAKDEDLNLHDLNLISEKTYGDTKILIANR